MNENTQARLTREFAEARRTNGVISAPAAESVYDFVDAYGLQENLRAELDTTVVGWKLAAPPASEVISAPLFDTSCFDSEAVLEVTGLLRDGVECELALRIDHPLPLGGCTREDVMAAVGAVMPAFELLSSRLPAKFASPRQQIVADCMGNGAVVLGAPRVDWRTLDLAQLKVSLWADDVLVIDKHGGNPFGDPLLAVALLANHLALRGQSLGLGTFVLAGSHTGVHRARPGERLRCVFEGIGEVALQVRETVLTTSKEN
ncbi:fumarylacetoacetate hydrolase family protein [Polaromonas sp. P2-4]|nr:fumarylacetoacetate hydrolase family protein [Polaromonas sp. P2-4]